MIPSRWPDATMLILPYLRTSLGGKATRTKSGAENQIVVASEPQQLETPISRRYSIILESWAYRANGTADPQDAVALMDDAMFALQKMPGTIRFDTPQGPAIVKDSAGFEYAEGSIVLVFARI